MSGPTLAIDIGGSHVSGGVVHEGRYVELVTRRRAAHAPVPDVVALVEAMLQMIENAGEAPPTRIGIAIAGLVDDDRSRIVASENLGDVDARLASTIARRSGIPTTIETDAFCLGRAIAEHHPSGTVLSIAVGTGIGHALIVDGRVMVGDGRSANRFGHVRVATDGPECYCGGRGCVCQYSAGAALHEASRTPAGRAGATRMLGRAIGAAVQLCAPRTVVLSGGPVWAGVFGLDELADAVGASSEPHLVPSIGIHPDRDAIHLGAALVAAESTTPKAGER